jgi:hypothetical protein
VHSHPSHELNGTYDVVSGCIVVVIVANAATTAATISGRSER